MNLFTKTWDKAQEVFVTNLKSNITCLEKAISDSLQIEDQYKVDYRFKWSAQYEVTYYISYLKEIVGILATKGAEDETYCTVVAGSMLNPFLEEHTQVAQTIWIGWMLELGIRLGFLEYHQEIEDDEVLADQGRGYFTLNPDSTLLVGLDLSPTNEDKGINIPNKKKGNPKRVLGKVFTRQAEKLCESDGLFYDHCQETLDLISSAELIIDPHAEGIYFNKEDYGLEDALDPVENIEEIQSRKEKEWNLYGAKISSLVKVYAEGGFTFYNGIAPDARGRIYVTNDLGNFIGIKPLRGLIKLAKKEYVAIPAKYL